MGKKSGVRAVSIWANGVRVGEWRIPSRQDEEIQYDRAWKESAEGRPLSLSLPFNLENSPNKGVAVHNYFDNLLPDSEPIRQRLQRKFKTESQGAFDLLVAIGRDCVGAVQLLPVDEHPGDIRNIEAEPLDESEVEAALIQATSSTPLHAIDEGGFRISIAGAQEKSAFLFHEGRWCRPLGTTPTTHIFKLPLGLIGGVQADMRKSVENEWLCSRIASAFKLPVAECQLGTFGSQRALIVERFDRQIHSSGKYWLRLVQEDFCQALGLPPAKKYEADGGPGVLEMAKILRGSESRDQDLQTILKAQILFWMLAAGDGHAKNFSIRLLTEGRYQLTPLYDIISYWPIAGEGPNRLSTHDLKMAMSIRGKHKHYKRDEILPRHFQQMSAQIGLGEIAIRTIEEITKETPKIVSEAQKECPKDFPQDVLDSILNGLADSSRALAAMADSTKASRWPPPGPDRLSANWRP